MRDTDAVQRDRLAGARRRALDEGREPPPEPPPTAAPPLAPRPSEPATSAASAAPAPPRAPTVAATEASAGPEPGAAPQPVARTPWFDARAFFLGWLGMIVALAVGASALLVVAAGFAVAALLARRGRLANGVASVVGATIAALLLLTALFIAGVVLGT